MPCPYCSNRYTKRNDLCRVCQDALDDIAHELHEEEASVREAEFEVQLLAREQVDAEDEAQKLTTDQVDADLTGENHMSPDSPVAENRSLDPNNAKVPALFDEAKMAAAVFFSRVNAGRDTGIRGGARGTVIIMSGESTPSNAGLGDSPAAVLIENDAEEDMNRRAREDVTGRRVGVEHSIAGSQQKSAPCDSQGEGRSEERCNEGPGNELHVKQTAIVVTPEKTISQARTSALWKVIYFVREFYQRHRRTLGPTKQQIVHELWQEFGAEFIVSAIAKAVMVGEIEFTKGKYYKPAPDCDGSG